MELASSTAACVNFALAWGFFLLALFRARGRQFTYLFVPRAVLPCDSLSDLLASHSLELPVVFLSAFSVFFCFCFLHGLACSVVLSCPVTLAFFSCFTLIDCDCLGLSLSHIL